MTHPSGWKLVPTKPTKEMLLEMNLTGIEGYDTPIGDGFALSLYHAALLMSPDLPRQGWVGLSGYEFLEIAKEVDAGEVNLYKLAKFYKAVEAKLKEKNS